MPCRRHGRSEYPCLPSSRPAELLGSELEQVHGTVASDVLLVDHELQRELDSVACMRPSGTPTCPSKQTTYSGNIQHEACHQTVAVSQHKEHSMSSHTACRWLRSDRPEDATIMGDHQIQFQRETGLFNATLVTVCVHAHQITGSIRQYYDMHAVPFSTAMQAASPVLCLARDHRLCVQRADYTRL